MNQGPDQPEKLSITRRMFGVRAAAAGLTAVAKNLAPRVLTAGAALINEAEQNPATAETTMTDKEIEDAILLSDARPLLPGERRLATRHPERSKIVLDKQIAHIESRFAPGQPYYNEWYSESISRERLGELINLVAIVSDNMARAYARGTFEFETRVPLNVDLLKQNAKLRKFHKKDGGGSHDCNEYYMQMGGSVRAVTAKHCVSGTVEEETEKYKPPEYPYQDADIMGRPVSKDELKVLKGRDIPEFSGKREEPSIIGKIVASFSFSPSQEEKPHLSFALSLPPRVRKLLFGEEVDALYPDIKHSMFYIKPRKEGQVLRRDSKGEVLTLEASGSSGSGVALRSGKDFLPLGDSIRVMELGEYATSLTSEAIATFSDPMVTRSLMERLERESLDLERTMDTEIPKASEGPFKGREYPYFPR